MNSFKKIFRDTTSMTLSISVVIFLLLLASSSFFHVLNKTLQNSYYAIKNEIQRTTPSKQILIVELDEASLQEIWPFPFDRSVYAKVIQNLWAFDVGAIGLDFLFLDEKTQGEDAAFIQSLNREKHVTLGSSITADGKIIPPFVSWKDAVYKTWFLAPNIDASNKTVYSFTPKYSDTQWIVEEHFALQTLRNFLVHVYGNRWIGDIGEYSVSQYLFSKDISIPLSARWEDDILINFLPEEGFQRVSFLSIYDLTSLRELDAKIGLKDKIILIWPAAEGLKDEFFTPYGVEYGVNIHANIINTILTSSYMIYFNSLLEWILIFLIIILSVYVNLSPKKMIILFGNLMIIFVFWILFPISILVGTNLILNYPSEIILSLILAVASANIVKYSVEDKNKTRLNKALSEYVGTDIAEEILSQEGKVHLDGAEKELICMFSDIEGFTTLSEGFTPKQLVLFLREYLWKMTSIIMNAGGYVDKFEWDAIMAFWWWFSDISKKDFYQVCATALQRKEALYWLNTDWEKRLPGQIRVRIGIHAWPAIVGNIGAAWKKMEFTALWDTVNIASRLEWVNKFYGTKICVSETIYEETKTDFDYRFIDIVKLQGKTIPVKIYELLGHAGTIKPELETLHNTFSEAYAIYRAWDFTRAKTMFQEIYEQGDSVAWAYVRHCEYFIKFPPPDDWGGIWKMTEK